MNYENIINDRGVYLYKDNSFNTIVFELSFEAPLGNREQAIKSILGEYITRINKIDNTEEKMNKRIRELYQPSVDTHNSIYKEKGLFTISFDIISFNASLDDYSSEVFEFFNNIINKPDFTNEELLETIKRVYLNRKISNLSNPDSVSSKLFKDKVLTDERRKFELSTDEEYIESIVSSITLSDLESMYKTIISNFRKGIVFGDITDEQFKSFREKINFTSESPTLTFKEPRSIKNEEIIIDAPDTNESVCFITYEIDDLDYPTYELLSHIFNSSCGLCHEILREKYGLVYTSYLYIRLNNNTVSFYAKIDKDNLEKLLSAIDEIIDLASNKESLKGLLEYSKKKIEQSIDVMSENRDELMGHVDEYISGIAPSTEETLESIKNTSEEDIIKKIKSLRNRNVFMYRGVGNE